MARPAATPAKRSPTRRTRRPADAAPVGGPGTPAQGRELRARGQRTLRKLLDAGIQVFSTKGFHPARVDDIVKVARTSHGTFYLYFANKEDLFAAVVQDVAAHLTALTDELGPIGPDDAGRAELRGFIAAFSDVYEQYGTIIRTWTEAEVDESALGQLGTDVLGGIATELAGHLRGIPRDVDAQDAALALVAMIERFNYFVATGQVQAERDQIVDTLTAATHAALFGT